MLGASSIAQNQRTIEYPVSALTETGKYAGWETPVPFRSVELPKFPVTELPSIVSDYVRAVAETTQTSTDMASVASLAILALCLQGKFKIEGKKDWVEPLNLYTLVIAPPAERKSAVMMLMSEPVKRFETAENVRLEPLLVESRIKKLALESREKILEKKLAKNNFSETSELQELAEEISGFEELRPCRLFCDDVTPEKLSGILENNDGRMAILSSEGGIFDVLAGRYSGNTNIDVFLKAHSGDSIRVDRQGRASEYIQNPALTTLIFAQPNVMTSLISNGIFHGRGMCARFLYSIPVSTVGSRNFESKPIPQITSDRYYNLIENLLKTKNNEVKIIKLGEGAYDALKVFAEKIEPMLIDELSEIADFAGKFVGAVLRIAGLLYLAENVENITDGELAMPESFMRSAIIIGKYFLEHAKAAYQLMGTDEVAEQCKYILRHLQKSQPTIITVRDVMRACRRFEKADETLIPLNRLCEYGYLKESKSKTWEVNPITYNLKI